MKTEIKDQEPPITERIEALSQELFGKPLKDVKHVIVTNHIHQQLLQEEVTRTGLYQWLNVFNGEIKYPRDIVDYNEYDIVQVNLSAQDVYLINDIREKIGKTSKTKLVVNNDYTTEIWGGAFEYTSTLSRELQGADMLFGTEYFQSTALSEISGRKVYVVPHPTDIKRLKSLPQIPKKDLISVIWRRYDNNKYIPSLMVRNHGLTTQLIGFDDTKDNKVFLTTTLYDFVIAGTNYFDFCDQLRENKIILDPFTYHSYSRTTVDTAALGVAVVGSNRTQSMNVCYPHTTIDPWDVKKARELIKRLIDDEEFYNLVVNTALEKCEFYNHENSAERYLGCLADALKADAPAIKEQKPFKKVVGSGEDVHKVLSQKVTRENVNKKK